MDAHVVGEDLGRSAVHIVAGLKPDDLLAQSIDNTGELDESTVAAESTHANQNHVILWLNHGPNLRAAIGRRLDQKVYFQRCRRGAGVAYSRFSAVARLRASVR